jgi:predicted amidohydrolase YtcJ
VVLDRNLLEIPDEEVGKARVLLTLIEGREIYRAPEL